MIAAAPPPPPPPPPLPFSSPRRASDSTTTTTTTNTTIQLNGDAIAAEADAHATIKPPPPPAGWILLRPLRRQDARAREPAAAPLSALPVRAATTTTTNDNHDIHYYTHNDNHDAMNVAGDVKGGGVVTDTRLVRSETTRSSSWATADEEGLRELRELRSDDELLDEDDGEGVRQRRARERDMRRRGTGELLLGDGQIKVYKRRWFGLVQLVLLNVVVSWDWLSFSASSTTVAQYYQISETAVNWLSTGFLFSFVVISPLTIIVLHRGGPKASIVTASVLLLLGNWIRYAATRAGSHGNYGGVLFGQILTGFSQPFVLAAPTRYSDLWFTNRGRVAATAVMSLANPFGGALAQLIDPFWANTAKDIPNMVLYIAIISTVACLPSFFIPSAPPTPSSLSAHHPKQPLLPSIRRLLSTPEFYLIVIPFFIYVGLFNSFSSLINQILSPYSFSETEAGIAGALLIVVGLVCAAVTSPIIDKTKSYLLTTKICVVIVAAAYTAFTWAPQTRSIAASYAILSVLGAASFSLVPVVLEFLIEITHPVSPEVTSTICWTGGQLTGGIFILISDALRDPRNGDGSLDDGSIRPPGNMWRALIFQTVLALVVVPLALVLGCCGRAQALRMKRVEADEEAERRASVVSVALP